MFAFCFSGLQLGFFPVARPEVVKQNSVFDKKIIMDLIRIDCYFEKLEVFIRFLCQLFQLTLSVGQQKSKLFAIFRLSRCSTHVWAFRAELFITFVREYTNPTIPSNRRSLFFGHARFLWLSDKFRDQPRTKRTWRMSRRRCDICHVHFILFWYSISQSFCEFFVL